VAGAIILDAIAYKRIASQSRNTTKGIVVSALAGILMGFFYRFVADSMGTLSDGVLEAGKLSPYTAIVLFSLGLFLSNFIWNTIFMAKPLAGDPVPFGDYFTKGNIKLHAIGILGGAIWNLGMSLSILAAGAASFAISYGLGQGATMIAAIWGVFIWKEFASAPKGTNKLLAWMFVFYIIGLVCIIAARTVFL
jgi:glucose uptake protein